MDEVDVAILGMGVGGEEVGGRLAAAGRSVLGIEHRLVGGECPYWACVPTKMMIRAGDLLAAAGRVPGMAGSSDVTASWAPVARRLREATDDWDDKAAVDRFTAQGGRFIRGYGRLAGPGRVEVGGEVFAVRTGVVLGVGTAPAVPPIDGLAGTPYWTNREAVETQEVPVSLVVLGGGPVGVEFGQLFARFGSEVTLLEAGERLLAREEPESGELARQALAADGVTVRTRERVVRVEHDGAAFTLHLDPGGPDGPRTVTAERLLVATGRRANLADIGLDTVGLDPSARVIEVDDRLRAAPGLWAVGDITGHGAFTHVSMYQADIVVRDILGQGGPGADYRALPRVTFTDPEIGAVGLTEEGARRAGIAVRVGRSDVGSSARGWIHGPGGGGFIKLVQDAGSGLLVGATSAGPAGGEVLSALVVAVHAQVPVEQLRSMIYAYPTFHRAIEPAVRELTGG